ncbi:YceI family protein [Pedobacter deserti]|uniref:YceI family protein n=1 Tax=Pedobacter deserti TaxID=2817382 RepID=UPI00210CA89E|nr:YceI family protein [Pedobacter sp. SYSU D00382]
MKLKTTSLALLLVAFISTAFVKPVAKPVSYTVDTEKSSITWVGKKLTGGHNGTIALQSGSLLFDGKKLSGGNFVIDMTTIKDADKSERLEGHLKADDFFGVDKFATSTFAIKKLAQSGNKVNITGNLTIKGVTQSITFPATIAWNSDGTVTAVAEKIVVDRTKFGIKYRSKGMFPDVGDKMIYDEFELAVKLVAKK